MMRIGPNAAGTAGTGALPEPDHSAASRYQRPPGEEDIGRHPGGARRDALGGEMRESGQNPGTAHREAQSRSAFEQSLKRALDEAGHHNAAPHGSTRPGAHEADVLPDARSYGTLREWDGRQAGEDDPTGEADAATLKLLALAERPPGFALMPAAPVADAAPAGTEQAIRVEALALRIEEAVRAELYAAPGRPIALKLDLGGLVPGLMSVTIAMTPDGIDVTLARGEGEASAELVQAAQALAERLQTRFAKRVVRVLDAPVAAAKPDDPAGTPPRTPEIPA